MRIAFRTTQARLEAGTGDEAQATEETDATLDGGENGTFTIAFNPAYLIDGLTAVGADTVRIALTTPTRPAILTAASDPDSYQHVLMPIRGAG